MQYADLDFLPKTSEIDNGRCHFTSRCNDAEDAECVILLTNPSCCKISSQPYRRI